MPKNWVLGTWVIVTVVQVLGKHVIIGYLDPLGSTLESEEPFPLHHTVHRSYRLKSGRGDLNGDILGGYRGAYQEMHYLSELELE